VLIILVNQFHNFFFFASFRVFRGLEKSAATRACRAVVRDCGKKAGGLFFIRAIRVIRG
jgi:hypothetical protein